MGNKEWKVGDKILCVNDTYKLGSKPGIKRGKEYVIESFGCCPGCGLNTVYLKGLIQIATVACLCGTEQNKERENYSRSRFIRPDLESLTEYRNQVSVREIPSELKILKNLEN